MIMPVHSDAAPRANGHYSQAVISEGVLYMSMQLPIVPETGIIPPDVEEQAEQLFRNCGHILEAGGSSYGDVLSATIYLTDMADWPLADDAFRAAVGSHKPARGMVCVQALHLGARIALQLVARQRTSGGSEPQVLR